MSAHQPRDTRAMAKCRRQFVAQYLGSHDEIADASIAEEGNVRSPGWTASPQSLNDDAEWFTRNNIPIVRPKSEGKFITVASVNRWAFEQRVHESPEEKNAMGKLIANIMLGPKVTDKRNSEKFVDIGARVFSMLDEQAKKYVHYDPVTVARGIERVKDRLTGYFDKAHRWNALDAGTSTAATARALASIAVIPSKHSRLGALGVMTNSPRVAAQLDRPDVPIKVVLAGGELRKNTLACAGMLAMKAFEAWRPNLDIAVIGTTALEHSEVRIGNELRFTLEGFSCDAPEEAEMKHLLLHHSKLLRIVLMDATKCRKVKSATFVFAPISDEHVDLVITDDRILYGGPQELEHYDKCLESLWRAGIPVLVAPSEKTDVGSSLK